MTCLKNKLSSLQTSPSVKVISMSSGSANEPFLIINMLVRCIFFTALMLLAGWQEVKIYAARYLKDHFLVPQPICSNSRKLARKYKSAMKTSLTSYSFILNASTTTPWPFKTASVNGINYKCFCTEDFPCEALISTDIYLQYSIDNQRLYWTDRRRSLRHLLKSYVRPLEVSEDVLWPADVFSCLKRSLASTFRQLCNEVPLPHRFTVKFNILNS